MKPCLVDTNLIVRFLTGEAEKQAARAKGLFAANESGELTLKAVPLVVAEVVFVLSGKVYGYERNEVASALIPFLQSPSRNGEPKRFQFLMFLAPDNSFKHRDTDIPVCPPTPPEARTSQTGMSVSQDLITVTNCHRDMWEDDYPTPRRSAGPIAATPDIASPGRRAETSRQTGQKPARAPQPTHSTFSKKSRFPQTQEKNFTGLPSFSYSSDGPGKSARPPRFPFAEIIVAVSSNDKPKEKSFDPRPFLFCRDARQYSKRERLRACHCCPVKSGLEVCKKLMLRWV